MYHLYVTNERDGLVSVNPKQVYTVYTTHCLHPVYVGPSESKARDALGMSQREWDDLLDTRILART